MIKTLTISGFRGFGQKQTIEFALPNGTPGGGLTVITGANNSGKTTIIEAIQAFNGYMPSYTPTFSEGRRNAQTGKRIHLALTETAYSSDGTDKPDETEYRMDTVEQGGSEVRKTPKNFSLTHYVLQSRRHMNYEFGKQSQGRNDYVGNYQRLEPQRTPGLSQFQSRIFAIHENGESRRKFDGLLKRVLDHDFEWTIEQRDGGQYYLKHMDGNVSHSSEGLGDGVWSVFTICAALFDMKDGETVVIDEPELSLHPALQKRLMKIFVEYSATRQIIISTHSPYFVDWKAIQDGAQLIRTYKSAVNSRCAWITDDTRKAIKNRLNDIHNPHIFGLEANEALFLEDGIILVEGQEDVVIFRKIAEKCGTEFNGDFFGWGVGGAGNMDFFLQLFSDLDYQRVAVIYDGDKKEKQETAKKKYTKYAFFLLVKDDIRDKKAHQIEGKEGISDKDGNLKPEHEDYMKKLIRDVNQALKKHEPQS